MRAKYCEITKFVIVEMRIDRWKYRSSDRRTGSFSLLLLGVFQRYLVVYSIFSSALWCAFYYLLYFPTDMGKIS